MLLHEMSNEVRFPICFSTTIRCSFSFTFSLPNTLNDLLIRLNLIRKNLLILLAPEDPHVSTFTEALD
jgi:hypothetical protein